MVLGCNPAILRLFNLEADLKWCFSKLSWNPQLSWFTCCLSFLRVLSAVHLNSTDFAHLTLVGCSRYIQCFPHLWRGDIIRLLRLQSCWVRSIFWTSWCLFSVFVSTYIFWRFIWSGVFQFVVLFQFYPSPMLWGDNFHYRNLLRGVSAHQGC